MSRCIGIRRGRVLALVVLSIGIAASLTLVARAALTNEDYKNKPGYVDFEPVLGGMEATVEVYLKGALLLIAREAVEADDPELGELLSKIEYVHVRVFPMKGSSARRLADKTDQLAEQLEKKGWELTVRVREDAERVHVYLLPGEKGDIAGLVVMAIEEGDEAAFVNVVGNINPAEVGRIGRTFHIDSMDAPIEVEVKGDAKMTVRGGEKHDRETD